MTCTQIRKQSRQVSLEPLKPFRAIVEVVVKRKTGGGRWRYEVKVEATDAPPDDNISLRASVGGASSAVFRLCNRYLGYAPFQVCGNEGEGGRRRSVACMCGMALSNCCEKSVLDFDVLSPRAPMNALLKRKRWPIIAMFTAFGEYAR